MNPVPSVMKMLLILVWDRAASDAPTASEGVNRAFHGNPRWT